MVHALQELRRVLVPGGILIDLRPIADGWPVEVASQAGIQTAGQVTDLPEGLGDDAAANAAMAEAERAGWFGRQREETFPFYYSWDTPREMQAYVEEEWTDFIKVEPAVWSAVRSLWSVAEAEARVRVRLKMLITRWVKRP
jgi:SAM-dependent methyltransferase